MVSPQVLNVDYAVLFQCNRCGFVWLSSVVWCCPDCQSFDVKAAEKVEGLSLNDKGSKHDKEEV